MIKSISSFIVLFFVLLYFPLSLQGNSRNFTEPKTSPTSRDKNGKLPSDLLKDLFFYYQTKDFKKVSKITSGKMGDAAKYALNLQKNSSTKLPNKASSFYDQLSDYKVLGEREYKNFSIVSLFWVLHLPEKYNNKIYYSKITYVDYLLKKDNQGNWKITDAKFKNEYMLYNKVPKL